MSEGALDNGPGHDTALRRMLDINTSGRPSSCVPVNDVGEVVRSGYPFPVFEDLRLEGHVGL